MISLLSVFWLYNNKLYGPEAILSDEHVVVYGDYAQLDEDHFAIWPTVAKKIGLNSRRVEYDQVPRARILFHVPTHHFIVIGCKAIVENEEAQELVRTYYGLPQNTEFRRDEHYR